MQCQAAARHRGKQWNRERQLRALPRFAPRGDRPTLQLHQRPHDRQTQTQPFYSTPGLLDSKERVEYLIKELWRNTRPGIANGDPGERLVLLPHRHRNAAALRGKLHRILDQIVTIWIRRSRSAQTISGAGGAIASNVCRLAWASRRNCSTASATQCPRSISPGTRSKPPGLNSRAIQQVLNHTDQPV